MKIFQDYLIYAKKVQSKNRPTDREFSFDVTRNEVYFRLARGNIVNTLKNEK